jgi:hypothetical protein
VDVGGVALVDVVVEAIAGVGEADIDGDVPGEGLNSALAPAAPADPGVSQ